MKELSSCIQILWLDLLINSMCFYLCETQHPNDNTGNVAPSKMKIFPKDTQLRLSDCQASAACTN